MPNYLGAGAAECDHERQRRWADRRVTTDPRWDSERGLAWPDAGRRISRAPRIAIHSSSTVTNTRWTTPLHDPATPLNNRTSSTSPTTPVVIE